MRTRSLVPALAVAAAALLPAGTAQATDLGCGGIPTIPEAYVCVAVYPENAPNVTGGSGIPVTVPSVCYFAGCTAPKTVYVSVPGVTPGSGQVVVVTWGGTDAVGAVADRAGQLLGDAGDDVDALLEKIGNVDWARVIENVMNKVPDHVPVCVRGICV